MDLNLLHTSTMLGLGCSTFGGSQSKAAAVRSLHHAYDQGIVYFDVARSYGYGTAESIVGAFAAGKRDQLFIASKFGICPPPTLPFHNALLAGVRTLRKLLPGTKRSIRAASTRTLVKPEFTPQLAESSLHTSLKELKTSYLDIFLLHESNLSDVLRQDLIYTLEKAKEQGKIRSWGGTFTDHDSLALAATPDSPLRVMQFPFGLDTSYENLISQNKQQVQIIYSVLSGINFRDASHETAVLTQVKNTFPQLHTLLSYKEVLLHLAFHGLPQGVVLLSMSKPEHISRNIAICNTPMLTLHQQKQLLILLRQQIS